MSASPSSDEGEARHEPVSPGVLGAYDLVEVVGRGWPGVLYRARHRVSGACRAIRCLDARWVRPGSDEARALGRDVAAAAQLDHPGMVRVHEMGDAGDCVYVATEWVEGPGLEAWLSGRELAPLEAARLLRPVVEAIVRAHSTGVVHGHIHAREVVVDETGRLRLAGFGLQGVAGLPTAEGVAAAQGVAADLSGLGSLLYLLLTGKAVRDPSGPGGGAGEVPVPASRWRPGIPGGLEAICDRCLGHGASPRHGSVRELLEDLDRFLAGTARDLAGRGRAGLVSDGAHRGWVAWLVAAVVVCGVTWWAVMRVQEATRAVAREKAARAEAEWMRQRAEGEAEKARRGRYAAHMGLAFESFNQGLREGIVEALRREDDAGASRGMRGWEWGFLSRGGTSEGGVTLSFTNLGSGVVSAGLLGDGMRAWVATASGMQAWDIAGARMLHEVPADEDALASGLWMGGEGTSGWAVRAWLGGRVGVRGLDGEAATISVEEPGWRAMPRYSGAFDMGLSLNGRRLVLADVANGVRVYEVPGMSVVKRFPVVGARTAGLSDNGELAVAADASGHVWIWRLSDEGTNVVSAMVPQVLELGFTTGGRHLLAGTLDGWVRWLDPASGREVGACGPAGASVLAMAMDPEGRRVAAGLSDGRVVFWDSGSRAMLGTLRPGLGAVQELRFLGRDGLAIAGTGGVRVYPASGPAASAPAPR